MCAVRTELGSKCALCRQFQVGRAGLLDNDAAGAGERGRLSENRLAIMWGWSRRTDGQALKGGGRQQAALKTRAKRAQATGEIHVLFTEDGLGLRMAAELGCNAFKLERLAQRLSRYALLSSFVQVKMQY